MPEFALIGYPISHSLSPQLFKKAYGGKWSYDLIETPSFEKAWETFLDRYTAINITAPFKEKACGRADILSPVCELTGAANIAVKTARGIEVYNSDYLAVRQLLKADGNGCHEVAVIGIGGAGKAAIAAARDEGFEVRGYHHDEIEAGVIADIIIYTLPRDVKGTELLRCGCLIESNYRDAALKDKLPLRSTGCAAKYIDGLQWLKAQALTGYKLMTGEEPLHF